MKRFLNISYCILLAPFCYGQDTADIGFIDSIVSKIESHKSLSGSNTHNYVIGRGSYAETTALDNDVYVIDTVTKQLLIVNRWQIRTDKEEATFKISNSNRRRENSKNLRSGKDTLIYKYYFFKEELIKVEISYDNNDMLSVEIYFKDGKVIQGKGSAHSRPFDIAVSKEGEDNYIKDAQLFITKFKSIKY
jgi:hypothetical protein